MESLEDLSRLTTLHLRDNKIETLDGFSENLKQLQYVNLRFVFKDRAGQNTRRFRSFEDDCN